MAGKYFKLIVHGGAWDIPGEVHKNHIAGIEQALHEGLSYLRTGSDAITAVIRAVMTMENDPTFDAGKGSFLNLNGEVEMDAMIMDGKDLSFGAVAAIQNVQYPILAANAVRLQSEHCFLAGSGATQFAHETGIPYWPTENLLVGRELERYHRLKKTKNYKTRDFFDQAGRDTVGAVAIDSTGNIAAATSTGGTPNKLPGRVGDSPVIGAGAFADNGSGGVSSTGWGESIMKVLLAKTTCDCMASGQDAQTAAGSAIQHLAQRVAGLGGVVCIDANGRHGYAYNTPYMARGIADQTGIQHVGI